MVHVDLVYLVEHVIHQVTVENTLRLHWNHELLKNVEEIASYKLYVKGLGKAKRHF